MLALALALSGLADGFHAETTATVEGVGATSWVLSTAAHGSVVAFGAFPESDAAAVAAEPGVHRASPVLFAAGQAATISGTGAPIWVDVVGVRPGGLGDPKVVTGHGLEGPDQVVVDSKLQGTAGGTLYLGHQPLLRWWGS